MPAVGIIVSAILSTILVLIQAAGTSGFQSFYSLVVGLSTMAAVIPYAFCAMAAGLIAAHAPGEAVPRVTVVEIIAFVFAVFTLYGCGAEAVLYGVVLLFSAFPSMCGSGAARRQQWRGGKVIKSPRPLIQINA